MMERFKGRRARVPRWRLLAAHAAIFVAIALGFESKAAPEEARPCGNVLLVRGIFSVFSLGLDDLAKQLQERGVEAQVTPTSLAFASVERLCQKYASGQTQGPVVLIGHSLGADVLPVLARQMGNRQLTVDLMIMIDSTNPANSPANVRRCVNLYQSNFSPEWFRVFRGAPIEAENPQTQLVNVDIRKLAHQGEADRIHHFNIESSPWIHRLVLQEVGLKIPAALQLSPGGSPGTSNPTHQAPASVATAGRTSAQPSTRLRNHSATTDPASRSAGPFTPASRSLSVLPLLRIFPDSEAPPR